MELWSLAMFGISFLLGVGLGRALSPPLRGLLMGAGFLLAAFAVISPEGAIALGKGVIEWAVGQVLAAMGYPPEWAGALWTPEWGRVLERIATDAIQSVAGVPHSPQAIENLGRVLLSRLDLAFGLGVLAGLRA